MWDYFPRQVHLLIRVDSAKCFEQQYYIKNNELFTSGKVVGADVQSVLVAAALRRIFRPLVCFLLAKGVTYPYVAELLKSVFVDVAKSDFALEGKRQTISRINLLTGVHRKDVKRLSATQHESISPPPNVPLGVQLVARWLSDKRYIDANGHPLPLPRLASAGGERSLEGLVATVSKDIRSRVVLDEWLRLGVVRLDENDRVSLAVEAFVPKQGFDEKVFYLGQNIGDHLSAAASNVVGKATPFLERSVYYDELSLDSIEILRKLCAELGMKALQQINQRAMELEARDGVERRATDRRMNFGIYFFDAEAKQNQGA